MKKIFTIIFSFSLIFSSCRTMSDYDFSFVDSELRYGNFSNAQKIIENDFKRIYSKHDEVLELLDKGILLHFEGEYSQSNEALSGAEKLIEAYRAKSISQAIGSAIVNDTVTDYAGEDFEDIYTNIFMCLNYIAMDMLDDAMVEIRRFDNKMKNIGSRYQAMRAGLEKQIEGDTSTIKIESVKFHNSALARYLSMLLYRADGNTEDARVDLQNLFAAFNMQKSLYDFSAPKGLQKELGVPSAGARINFVAFSGFSPIKQEETLRILMQDFYYKLALPVMKSRASSVGSINVKAISKDGGCVYNESLSKIESVDNIAKDTFNDHYGAIAMKTFLRSIIKATTGTALSTYGENSDSASGAISWFLGLIFQTSTEFTERADVRSSRYFPGYASVGSIEIPQGIYDVQIEFYSVTGKLIFTKTINDFDVKAGNALNLVEAVCYR